MIAPHSNKWVVDQPTTLLKFVKSRTSLSQRQIKEFVHRGLCTVGGRRECFSSTRLGPGTEVQLKMLQAVSRVEPTILFEDEHLLAYDKPALIASEEISTTLTLVHRLDKETSGVLLFAKTPVAAEAMKKLFQSRAVAKRYVAIVDGRLKATAITSRLSTKSRFRGKTMMAAGKKGLEAETRIVHSTPLQAASLVEIEPITGRMHQIRVHCSELMHPILGDFIYGKSFRCPYVPPRILLHAHLLSLLHPISQETLRIRSELPEAFAQAMDQLQ